MFVPGKSLKPSLMFVGNAGAEVSKKTVPPIYGRYLAVPPNIRLSWKGLPGTNTLAYYKLSYTSDV